MKRMTALVLGLLVLVAFAVAKMTTTSPAPPRALVERVRFRSYPLEPVTDGRAARHARAVNPAYARITGWISAVGAGAAMGDIAGDGKPDDICLVDPRYDTVSVMPAPNTGARFTPFALAAPAAGYKPGTTAPMGCLIGDFNEDGATDLLVYYWGRTPVIFQRDPRKPLGAAAFTPIELVPGHKTWFTNAAVQADFDGDGHVDLLFGNYFPDDSAVLDPDAVNHPTMQGSMSRAYNGGGLHLFLWKDANAVGPIYSEASDRIPIVRSKNAWGPTYPRRGWTLALAAADLNGDLRPEIYVANDFGPDQLLVNTTRRAGAPSFALAEGRRDLFTPRSKVLGQDSFKGMGVDVGSVTGDGRRAIAVSNISAPYSLIESHFLFVETKYPRWDEGNAPFHDESAPRGVWLSNWAWDIKFADLDNSGCPAIVQAIGFLKGDVNRWPQLQELAMSNDQWLRHPTAWPIFRPGDDLSGRDHDRVYLQDCSRASTDPGRFYDVSDTLDLGARWSVESGPPGTVSRGVAMGDVFGDGRLSLVIARQWMPSVFLCNVSPGVGRAIELNVRTPGKLGGDRPLIGATARVVLPGGRVVTDAVDGGSGHSGKRAAEIHLGLGQVSANQVFNVDLRWRDGEGVHDRTLFLRPGRYAYEADGEAADGSASVSALSVSTLEEGQNRCG